jgi:hypothetical protein
VACFDASVFANGSDPIQYGLVVSLNRPGRNIIGVTFINSQLGPKRIQLLRLLNAKTMVIAVARCYSGDRLLTNFLLPESRRRHLSWRTLSR